MDIQFHLADVNLYVTLYLQSLHGWGRHIGVTPSSSSSLETVCARKLYRWNDHEKKNKRLGFIISMRDFRLFLQISIGIIWG